MLCCTVPALECVMKVPPLLAHVAVFVGAALIAAFAAAAEGEPVAPEAERARELIHIVRQDCGSCHGLTLAGGLGPALTPEVLADRPFALSPSSADSASLIRSADTPYRYSHGNTASTEAALRT